MVDPISADHMVCVSGPSDKRPGLINNLTSSRYRVPLHYFGHDDERRDFSLCSIGPGGADVRRSSRVTPGGPPAKRSTLMNVFTSSRYRILLR